MDHAGTMTPEPKMRGERGRIPDRMGTPGGDGNVAPLETTTTWVVRMHPVSHPRLRLFCLPPAGGGATSFRGWANELPREIEICAIQLPGREKRLSEPPCPRLTPLVLALAQALVPCLDRPYAIFGHSMGALMAFELARELRRRTNQSPVHLLVSARPAPHLPPRESQIHQLPDSRFIDELCLYNGMPTEVLENAELMELLLPMLRADFAIVETYEHTPDQPLPCPISVFGGLNDPKVRAADLDAWRRHTRGEFALHMFEGDHQFINSQRSKVFRVLKEELENSLASLSGATTATELSRREG